jgi:hypothetical protein
MMGMLSHYNYSPSLALLDLLPSIGLDISRFPKHSMLNASLGHRFYFSYFIFFLFILFYFILFYFFAHEISQKRIASQDN